MMTKEGLLKIYKAPHGLIRVGRNNDGGYVIAAGFNYDYYIGCGVCDDISFDEELVRTHNIPGGLLIDGTLEEWPEVDESLMLHKINKNVSYSGRGGSTNLSKETEPFTNVFLKMDIEGSEREWAITVSDQTLIKYAQIVVEIHELNCRRDAWEALRNIIKYHTIVHIHGNNNAPTFKLHKRKIPNTIEVTLLRNNLLGPKIQDNTPRPLDIDMPNNPEFEDIMLDKPPFVIR